jgi:hypothetical protein
MVEGYADISVRKLWQYKVGYFLDRSVNDEASERMDILLDLNVNGMEYLRKC